MAWKGIHVSHANFLLRKRVSKISKHSRTASRVSVGTWRVTPLSLSFKIEVLVFAAVKDVGLCTECFVLYTVTMRERPLLFERRQWNWGQILPKKLPRQRSPAAPLDYKYLLNN